ncbi:hypothetical protein A1O1_00241 [Capronia coronata CBS 617.96]|uniref:Uncharacterized protein n=1 Tax=Capronia coronata CBS 617.96 TaxID=1182541 RepID=W9YQB6_9EURO|nr:uncharacterized protein A1O1_00241 [Capronia coronata CBS 617.96]EXJ95122.1 hypothetical protein A1O1_00241 [Capronia coronata CBS 617.96]
MPRRLRHKAAVPGAEQLAQSSSSRISTARSRPAQHEVQDGGYLVAARYELLDKLRRIKPSHWQRHIEHIEAHMAPDGTLFTPMSDFSSTRRRRPVQPDPIRQRGSHCA